MKKYLAVLAAVAVAGVAALAVPALGAATKTVKVLDFKFTPKTLTVKKGTKVTWKWGGKVDPQRHRDQGPEEVPLGDVHQGLLLADPDQAGHVQRSSARSTPRGHGR